MNYAFLNLPAEVALRACRDDKTVTQQHSSSSSTAAAAQQQQHQPPFPLSYLDLTMAAGRLASLLRVIALLAVVASVTQQKSATSSSSSAGADTCVRLDSPLTFLEGLMEEKLARSPSFAGFVRSKKSSMQI